MANAIDGVLVTGGAGYIGSHTVVALCQRGHRVVILDNFSNSHREVLSKIERLAEREIRIVVGDVRDASMVAETLATHRLTSVVHFAALKSVAESCARPLDYYDNNVGGTIGLLKGMRQSGVDRLVFSSSAAVYDASANSPIVETAALVPASAYGRTKLAMERVIRDVTSANPLFKAGCLRYFNPVGAHPSGELGEWPSGQPNNLMPALCHVASGLSPTLQIFGNDYATRDGTGVRDYLHVEDLARAHIDALEFLQRESVSIIVNLGTGRGTTVLELVAMFERVCGVEIAHEFLPRRDGDVAALFADPGEALRLLGWRAERDLESMCRDAWRWCAPNPGAVPPRDGNSQIVDLRAQPSVSGS